MESIYRTTIEGKVCIGFGLLGNGAMRHYVLVRELGFLLTQERWRAGVRSPKCPFDKTYNLLPWIVQTR